MVVPVSLKPITVLLNVLEEQRMQKPDVVRVFSLQEMEALQSGEKSPPTTCKVPAALQPESLYSGIVRGAEIPLGCCMLARKRKTYVPHINDARLGPRYMIIHVHSSTFSDPLSPRTLEGQPNSSTPWKNILSTCCPVFFDDACIAVTLIGRIKGQK
jgi:hypothetical protein